MEAKFLFWPCASIAPSLGSRVERPYEKSTIENHQKRNGVTELAEITNERRNRKGMRNEERVGGERRRAMNVESRKKAIGGKSKAKRSVESMHFENHPATPRSHVRVE